jgi:hypothetical protein
LNDPDSSSRIQHTLAAHGRQDHARLGSLQPRLKRTPSLRQWSPSEVRFLSDDGKSTGQQKSFIYTENVVIVTTLVDLTRQLSNLRQEVQHLLDQ